jgi:hypothetical protein
MTPERKRPSGAIRRNRPGPAGSTLDAGDDVDRAVLRDGVAGLDLVSRDCDHGAGSTFRTASAPCLSPRGAVVSTALARRANAAALGGLVVV